MHTSNFPPVVVGLPVYNGEHFLSKTLDSLVGMDYPNLEIIISDNASEDATQEICRAYARQDKRIRYLRNSVNLGPVKNGLRIMDACSSDFVMWASDHDLWHPTYVTRLMEEHRRDETVALAYARTVLIDIDGKVIKLAPDLLDTRGLDTCQRFSKIMWEFTWGNMNFGLYKTNVLRSAIRECKVISYDHVQMALLSLHGTIAQVDEPLFFRRMNRPEEDQQRQRQRQLDWLAKGGLENLVPRTMMAYEHVEVVKESRLSMAEKEYLFSEIKTCFPSRFGSEMQIEAMSLINEGSKAIAETQQQPLYQLSLCTELLRLAHICRFFYDIAEPLDTFTTFLENNRTRLLTRGNP